MSLDFFAAVKWMRSLLMLGPICVAAWVAITNSGCKTFEIPILADAKRLPSIDGMEGPLQRRLRGDKNSPSDPNTLQPIKGTEDFLAAKELFDAGDYPAAQKAFHKVAKKYKKSEIREDALFMEAEAALEQGHFATAHDVYGDLLKEFPSTTHIDRVSKNLFKIARTWLSYPEYAQISEIQQVNYDQPGKALPASNPVESKESYPLVPNFFDKSKPLFDPEGNGVSALRAIWLNDPTGPLADDALMLAASHYARRGKWIESDRYFSMLREEYPQSRHIQAAFELGSHVKLMSYQGGNYEARPLEDAQQLKMATGKLFNDRIDKDRLNDELKRVAELRAERDWEPVEFFRRKNRKEAMAIQCHLVIDRHPDTTFATKAQKLLRELGPEYADGSRFKQAPVPKTGWTWSSATTTTAANGDKTTKQPERIAPPDLQPVPNRWQWIKKPDPGKASDPDVPKPGNPANSPFPREAEPDMESNGNGSAADGLPPTPAPEPGFTRNSNRSRPEVDEARVQPEDDLPRRGSNIKPIPF